ncbi:MAG: methyltransferase domain-containing protein [Candidatus Omnitrophica bacterium]|nr:methyltransferase domain-containing protein [Candidatus Omnitrophota bacterium]MCM8803308.1 methyltransferase domain-containing protein [Candidatus Omnitrophota bacterium]
MKEITEEDYYQFLKSHDFVVIENIKVPLIKNHIIQEYEPKDFKLETTTIWSFPDRGQWATHKGNYRANWSPYIPRNLILRFTKESDLVLDQMVGSGTTLVECKLLNRNGIGVDINFDAIMVTRNRLDFKYKHEPEIKTYVGDARNLDLIQDESIDLIATHPPYANIVRFTNNKIEGDLSCVKNIDEFINEMEKIAEECYRVLKPGKHCAILIGDTRKKKHFVPISTRVMETFLKVGFILREDVIKLQWKMKSTREKWRGKKYDFLLLAHEHLFIFRKPEKSEKLTSYKNSLIW